MNWRSIVAILFVSLLLLPACQKKCKQGEDVDCWLDALKDPELAEKAIDNLKQIGDKKAEPALIEVFNESTKKPKYREKIAEIFKKWGTKSAVKPMLSGIDWTVGPDKDGRKAKRTNRANQKIASALGSLGDKSAAAPLMRLMKATKEANVRRSAIRALGKLKANEAVDELLRLSEDTSTHKIIRMNAIFALGEIGDPKTVDSLILSLYRDKAFFFFQAGLGLVRIGEPAIEPLVKTMNGKNSEAKRLTEENMEILAGALESNAAKILGDIGSEKAVEPLLAMVEKVGKWEAETNRLLVMTRLINALGTIGDKRGLKIALEYLKEELWDVRTICANTINNISDRSVVPELLKFASTGDHPKTRAPLIEAIGNLGTDKVLPALKKLLDSQKDVTVQKAVKASIKRIEAYSQCKQDVNCWIGKLADKQPEVREKAAYELGRIGGDQAIEPLIKIMNDNSENVRFAVMFAFDKIGSKKPVAAIEALMKKEKGSTRFKVINFNYQLLSARLSRTGK
ncbi:MAG: HEAT repeat domain-containing protein [Deltaproteobacteria bacterium]|nr:HEAT repeat domain-containing protein [Deltaproteobacteria bacterium]